MRIDIEDQSHTQFDVVAYDGGIEAGRLEANFISDVLPWEGTSCVDRFWISNVHVERQYRRRGVGRALAQAAKAQSARRFNVKDVYARISPQDGLTEVEVRALYAAMNLHEVGLLDVGEITATITRGPIP